MDKINDFVRPKKKQKIPVVLTQPEVKAILTQLSDTYWLAAYLLYGAGLRLTECMHLQENIRVLQPIGVGNTYIHLQGVVLILILILKEGII